MAEHWTTNILPTNEATLPNMYLTCSASSNHEYINHKLTNIALTPEYYMLYSNTVLIFLPQAEASSGYGAERTLALSAEALEGHCFPTKVRCLVSLCYHMTVSVGLRPISCSSGRHLLPPFRLLRTAPLSHLSSSLPTQVTHTPTPHTP